MLKINTKFLLFIFSFSMIWPLTLSFAEENIQILKDFLGGHHEFKFVVLPENTPLIQSFSLDSLKNDEVIKQVEAVNHSSGNYYLLTLHGENAEYKVSVYINIHSGIQSANIEMMELMTNTTSVYYNVLDYGADYKFGDNCWFNAVNLNPEGFISESEINAVHFIRNNVRIEMFDAMNYHNPPSSFIAVAEKIDQLLINSEKISAGILPNAPVIDSFDIISGSLIAGSTEVMTTNITATDPMGEKLYYRWYGARLVTENAFVDWGQIARRKQPGSSTKLLVWVINESQLTTLAVKEITFLDPTSVEDEGNSAEVPKVFVLYQNRPNPFNPATMISYDLSKQSDVVLTIHDTLGRKVRTLANSSMNPGQHEILWDGRDETGKLVSSGIYYCRISADGHTRAIGMTLLR